MLILLDIAVSAAAVAEAQVSRPLRHSRRPQDRRRRNYQGRIVAGGLRHGVARGTGQDPSASG